MAIRLIATDIDGTLLDSRWQLPDENRQAIEDAVAAGVEVALVTGRRFDFARPVAELFRCPLTLVVSNGALVKSRDGVTLLRHLLPSAVAEQVLDRTRAFRDAAAVVFDRPEANQVVFERIDWETPQRRSYAERNRAYIAEVAPLEACLTEDPIQVMFNGTIAAMRDLLAVLRGMPLASEFALAVTEYESRDFSLVDVIRRGCSKGATLAEWAKEQAVTPGEVLAIGDNLNDLEMLAFAGARAVMGNAVPELKHLGWPITGTNDEGGVARAIREHVLSRLPRMS